MVIAMNTAWLSTTSSWSILGYALLTIGILATLISSHRYLLGYLIAGMLYGLLVNQIHTFILYILPLDNWQAYVCALAITWIPLAIWSLYKISQTDVSNTSESSLDTQSSLESDSYIEHTPIYKKYQPRFHNTEQFHPKYK
ncbi:AciT family ciprofloxacin tolerance protein [Psychrobacter sp. I-STPA6b]|uniref:AciT family ciprofloxacin tolerance protein n=1 Tax=Psychrobacter sp. I-STPA6b TaxID=2585718 RepID=UPI001D0BFECB|nr:AciT family ciprofloxacin tolerance protein [Psychrobacter sp. I-STPA6b]